MITVHLGEIPEEGLEISGETDRDIFQFDESEKEVAPDGPVRYRLHVTDAGAGLLLAMGELQAPFQLRCVACLEQFPFTLSLDGYAADFDSPASGTLDLTERIREDLLLELPAYPHCERDGDDPDRVCPATELLKSKPDEGDADFGKSGKPSAWDVLDDLKEKDD